MKKHPLRLSCRIAAVVAASLQAPATAAIVTWDNSNGTSLWSTPANWDTGEPGTLDDAVFPAGLGGIITLAAGENAKTLQFGDSYTLNSGGLTLAAASTITVANGATATINTPVTLTGGTTKTGTGKLILNGSNTFTGGIVINAGTVRAGTGNAFGAAANTVTVNNTGTLEIGAGQTLDRAIALNAGSTLQAAGTSLNNGITTVAAGATVTLGTVNATDSLTMGNAANDFTGGAGATVTTAGPGAVRMSTASNYAGTYAIPAGTRLEIGSVSALGNAPASGITLSGGTLAGRSSAGLFLTGSQAGALTLSADSTLMSDRASSGSGFTYTFGTVNMGAHTLTATTGANATSGSAGVAVGNVTLSGNPVFSVLEPGAASMKLSTASFIGGGVARTITKTGPGDLSITGGATDLIGGSAFAASGTGSVYEFITPLTGVANPLVITPAMNPLGEATATITDGTVRLLCNGNGGPGAQTIQIGTAFTLGGTVTLDPDRSSGSSTTKTFELPGLTLAAGADLTMIGTNSNVVSLSAPLTLQGSATMRGPAATSRTGRINADAGLTGGAGSDTLTLAGGTSPLNLFLNAPGSFPGAVSITGANVTANAAAAFGTGAVSISSGTLTINNDAALQGTLTMTGGSTRVNDVDALALNPIALNGGTLDFRSNVAATIVTGALTLGDDATFNVANNGSGSSLLITLPTLNVTGTPVLTLTNGNNFTPLLPSIQLAGDLTINNGITARSTGITQDASPRKLLKTGAGTLELEAASTHSGGTEILVGTLLAEHADALGGGDVTLGDTSGTDNSTLRLAAGLAVDNDITVRAGSSGSMTIGAASPANTTLSGEITLQRGVTFDNSGVNPFNVTGRITGPHDVTRSGSGIIVLANGGNDFGTGGPASLNIASGTVSVGSDAPLGAGGITIGASGILRITETFATSRLITHASNAGILVDQEKMLTLNTALPADLIFDKEGTGTLAFGPSVVSTRTLGADVVAGTLRMTGAQGLSTGGVITMTNGTRLELMHDTNTVYPQSVASTASSGFTIHTDRADGGSATGGTHTIGPIALGTGSLTHTSANGFALTTGAVSTTGSANVSNDAAGLLTLPSLSLGGTSTTARTLTMETNGADIRVTGTLTETGTPIYNLTKRGAHTLRLESGLGLSGAVTLQGGTLDLNNTSNTLGGALTLGGENPASAVLLQSGAGTLTLGGNVTLTTSFNPPTATIAGAALDLGSADRTFTVPISSAPGADLEITSAITGSAGLFKTSSGVLRFSGSTANTFTGLTTITDGTLELGKTGANAIGSDGLAISGTSFPLVQLLSANQIPDTAPVLLDAVTTSALLNLAGFAETTGALTLRSADTDGARLTTGATGVLTLSADLTLENNRDSSVTNEREVLITGSGTEFAPASDGTLDLGGVNRTISVTSTVVSPNAALANATIETCITNGGIRKTGARALYLTNPHNNFAGGVTIEEGEVNTGGTGSLGSGGVTLANTGAANAILNLGSTGGTWPHAVTLTGGGTGCATLRYEGFSGTTMIFPHPLDLSAQGLCVDVVEGTNAPDDGAVLEITGAITDGASTFGITKEGGGILKLPPGNSHTGTTVNLGVLHVTVDSALGAPSGALTVNGGCFQAAGTMSLTRDFAFGANGGCIRVEQPDAMPRDVLTLPSLTWGGAEMGFFGGGQAILSATSGVSAANVVVGAQTDFARDEWWVTPDPGFVLSLRGTSQLPTGNLKLTNRSVLELGTGDFTRAVGTGPGEVQLPTTRGAGWAAFGADRAVNLGGSGALLVWGNNSVTTPFLADPGSTSFARGELILGSETATHTVDFQNDLEFYDGQGTGEFRTIRVPDGPAALEARISGDITYTPPVAGADASLEFDVTGALHVSGNLSGPLDIYIYTPGTVTLSGTNTHTGWLEAGDGGTIIIASDASAGTPEDIYVDITGHVNASAMTAPLAMPSLSYTGIEGMWSGSITTSGYVEGGGTITGNLTVNASTDPGDGIEPWSWDGITPLRVGGNLNLAAGAMFWAWADGVVPNAEYSQISVTGSVTLAGTLDIDFEPLVTPAEGDTYYILLNAGADPVNGAFAGLPEGASIAMPNGQTATITYLANGDGGPIGNDVAVVAGAPPPPGSDEVTVVDITQNAGTCQISVTVATDIGQDYDFEVSEDLVTWTAVESFTGDGTNRTLTTPLPAPGRQFVRVIKVSAAAAR